MLYRNLICTFAIVTFEAGTVARADSCFCKACCTWTDNDSCDFTKVQDVSCDLPVEKQKDAVRDALRDHVMQVHGGDEASKYLDAKTQIKCFRSRNFSG